MGDISSRGYTNPDVLVSTDWLADHLKDANIRIIESNEDPLLYPSGHIPGAVQVDWTNDLNDPLRRDYLNREGFEKLASRIGITNDTTLPIQIKIGFQNENYFRDAKQKCKAFILPEGLEPADELKKLLETPLGTTITLNKADGGNISEELKKLLGTQIPFTLTKIIER